MNWLMDNLATIVVGAVLLALVIGVVAYMRKQKRKNPGAGSCGCGCSACPMAENCAEKREKA
jgi:hypothetical protein